MSSSQVSNPLRVLVVGCGNMGASHAFAYHTLDGFEICGIVSTGKSKEVLNEKLGGGYPLFSDYTTALQETKPDAVYLGGLSSLLAMGDYRAGASSGQYVDEYNLASVYKIND